MCLIAPDNSAGSARYDRAALLHRFTTQNSARLYLMPSYDDIASLYYYNNRWNVHYLFEGARAAREICEAEAKPSTKATLRKVFDALTAHAG